MRRRVMGALAVLVIGGSVLGGCSRGADKPAAAKATNGGSPSAASSAGPNGKEPAKKQKKVADPLAPVNYQPVLRDGRRPRPSVSAKPAPMRGTVKYDDGITLDITGIRQGKVTGQGPGVVEGPTTTFDLTLRNGSRRTIDLNRVVVTVAYGDPSRLSSPIYDKNQRDFSGKIKPGRSAQAVYTFGVPTNGRDRVTVYVDFDAVHTAAEFIGAAR